MDANCGKHDGKNNALWGSGSRGETRSNALWGKGGRGVLLTLVALIALLIPFAGASADPGISAAVPADLLAAATAYPDQTFNVIVQADLGATSGDVVAATSTASSPGQVKQEFRNLDAISASLTGAQLLKLAKSDGVATITLDGAIATDVKNPQKWPGGPHVDWFWGSPSFKTPAATIAFVDSGVDTSNGEFGTRMLTQVDLTSVAPSLKPDGRGHGTFVAGVGAGAGAYGGTAPTAKFVSLKVFNDLGQGMTSDVLRACDWLVQNKAKYNIRVANFSLESGNATSFRFDPLDQAVEKLWQAGIVVVASSGNYAIGGAASGVMFSPANDPFVITVGALDTNGSPSPTDDFNAPWSSYGYTVDGFAKPELAAPGRYMIEWTPTGSSLAAERPYAVVKEGMQLSGTSFAAPVVAGVAANLIGLHPTWTPDQIKGAIMRATTVVPATKPLSAGVGEVNIQKAIGDTTAPPNPNAGLDKFLIPDPAGSPYPVFDSASWVNTALGNASWNSASWNTASWNTASWNSASWASASWLSASWNTASWLNVTATDNAAKETGGVG